jgi:IS5 family transposase
MPPGRNPEAGFKGGKRSNKTHQSMDIPESRLCKKGKFTEAKLRCITHALAGTRNGLVADAGTTQAHGRAEWEAGLAMAARSLKPGATVGVDKGYAMGLKRRKMVEEAFGRIKTVGGLRKTRFKGLAKLAGRALFTFAAYNLARLVNLMEPQTA